MQLLKFLDLDAAMLQSLPNADCACSNFFSLLFSIFTSSSLGQYTDAADLAAAPGSRGVVCASPEYALWRHGSSRAITHEPL